MNPGNLGLLIQAYATRNDIKVNDNNNNNNDNNYNNNNNNILWKTMPGRVNI